MAAAMREGEITGVLPVLVTPFDEREKVDLHSLTALVDHLVDEKVDGLVCLALASETYRLTDVERTDVARTVIEAAAGRSPVIVGVEHNATVAARARSEEAATAGASAVMAYPPSFGSIGPDAIVEYYRDLGASGLPLIVQDAPAWTGTQLPVALLQRIGDETDAVDVYVKVEVLPSAPKIAELTAYGIKTIAGYGATHLFEDLHSGATGLMPGCALVPRYVRLWAHHVRGDVDAFLTSYANLLPLLNFQMGSLDTFISVQKRLLTEAGVLTSSTVRRPGLLLTAPEQHLLDQLVRTLGSSSP